MSEAWMPSDDEIVDADDHQGLVALIRRAAAKRAIAALESLDYVFKHSDEYEVLERRIAALKAELSPITAAEKRGAERAVEELRALAKEMCDYCKNNLPFAVDPLDKETLFHDNEEGGVWNCWCPEIHARIAALEGEKG